MSCCIVARYHEFERSCRPRESEGSGVTGDGEREVFAVAGEEKDMRGRDGKGEKENFGDDFRGLGAQSCLSGQLGSLFDIVCHQLWGEKYINKYVIIIIFG